MTDREYPQVIEAQEHPVGSMAWILEPCSDREKIILLAYHLGGMSAKSIATQLADLREHSPTINTRTVFRYLRSGREHCYHHDNLDHVIVR